MSRSAPDFKALERGRPVGRGRSFVAEFLRAEAAGGVVLLVATIVALVWVNVSGASYVAWWNQELTLGVGEFALRESLRGWVSDGLMTLFFFVVGLEIKRELVHGELRDPRAACLPVVAAFGGMVMPALIFALLNAGGAGARGWGVPMATDIAFAVAVVAVLGRRVPTALKLFLLTLAVADDLGAIVVIAIFYSHGLSLVWLLAAVATIGGVCFMRRVGVSQPWGYVIPALVLWVCLFRSGVHATLAGVALGFLVPARPVRGKPVLERLEHFLHPWSTLLAVPLFAVASAGVVLDLDSLRGAVASPVAWGVALGLVVGKPAGIVLACLVALRLRVARLPTAVTLRHIVGAGAVAGMGFTVSLFVAQLSFAGTQLQNAKIAILIASSISALLGVMMLLCAGRVADAPRFGFELRGSASVPVPRREDRSVAVPEVVHARDRSRLVEEPR